MIRNKNQERRHEMKAREKIKLLEKENQELKHKLAERDQTTSELKISLALLIIQLLTFVFDVIFKILNYIK